MSLGLQRTTYLHKTLTQRRWKWRTSPSRGGQWFVSPVFGVDQRVGFHAVLLECLVSVLGSTTVTKRGLGTRITQSPASFEVHTEGWRNVESLQIFQKDPDFLVCTRILLRAALQVQISSYRPSFSQWYDCCGLRRYRPHKDITTSVLLEPDITASAQQLHPAVKVFLPSTTPRLTIDGDGCAMAA